MRRRPDVRAIARRGWQWTRDLWVRGRAKTSQMSLGARIFVALVSVATASIVIAGFLQDSALETDLQKAARARLEQASRVASRLLDEHADAQLERYRAIASTPQFRANLEAQHLPTLSHFADTLAGQQNAGTVMFLDRDGTELAGVGEDVVRARTRDCVRDALAAEAARGSHGEAAVATAMAIGGVPFSVSVVPLRNESEVLGSLVALERIDEDDFTTWSRLCGASVTVHAEAPPNSLTLIARSVGGLQLRVSTSLELERTALANSRWNLLTGGLIGIALACVVSVFLSRGLVRPIREIQAATERIGRGDLRSRLDVSRGDEVGDVARALNAMLDKLEENIRQRIRVENQISHLAYHDGLTGLGNRRLLKDRLEAALERTGDGASHLALMCLDLDRFKDVNDALGHTAGDELLLQVATRLNSCLQAGGARGDSGEAALLARLGGDEFTVLLTDVEDRAQIEQIADGILEALASPFELRGQAVALTASLGIALSPDDAADVETLLSGSDMAMFHAKSRGGRAYEFYSDSMEEIACKRLALEHRLRRALDNDEFELFYQPKIDLDSNQVSGVEALLRWRDPEHGMVSPDEFIPMAEETGAIIAIGEWVLRKAIEQNLEWQAAGLPPVRVAVNVSVKQVEQRVDFVQQIADLLDELQFDPRLLDLEITEGALLKDDEAAIAMFGRIRNLGVGLSLDDFGTGYSSLSYLRRLPIDTLKIDRTFIQGADTNPEDAALIEAIVTMAKALKLRVIVEGVETRKQSRFLDELGRIEVQGYLFAKAMSAADATEFLRKKRRRRRAAAGGQRVKAAAPSGSKSARS